MTFRELKNQVIEIPAFICLILTGFKLSGSIIAVDWSWWVVVSPLSIWVLYYLTVGFIAVQRFSKEFAKAHHQHIKERVF